jgi:hypothetical protein
MQRSASSFYATTVSRCRRRRRNALTSEVIDSGYEGYVAKDEASPYVSGRTRLWLKVKVPGWTVEDDQWSRRIAEPAEESPLANAASCGQSRASWSRCRSAR